MRDFIKGMTKALLVFLVLYILGSSDLGLCQKPSDVSMEAWLPSVDMGWSLPYLWDCSEAATYTSWLCRNCGYKVRTLVVEDVIGYEGEGSHAFIEVEIDGQWHAYNPWSYTWVDRGFCGEPHVTRFEWGWFWWLLKPHLFVGAL